LFKREKRKKKKEKRKKKKEKEKEKRAVLNLVSRPKAQTDRK
jgi:hypothetical protein